MVGSACPCASLPQVLEFRNDSKASSATWEGTRGFTEAVVSLWRVRALTHELTEPGPRDRFLLFGGRASTPQSDSARREQTVTETRSLAGTIVAVTGATAGIGRSTVVGLLEEGAKVVAVGRRQARLDELTAQFGSEALLTIAADVRTPEANRDIIARTVERFGRLDSVVLNAGVGLFGGIMDGSDDDLRSMLEVNLHSTIWGIRAAVPALLADGGDIIVVASVAAIRGGANEAVYASSKAGQLGLAAAVDRELHSKNIRVTAMCPAGVATEFALGIGRTEDMPEMSTWLKAEDISSGIIYALKQPRRMRTTQWVMWPAFETATT